MLLVLLLRRSVAACGAFPIVVFVVVGSSSLLSLYGCGPLPVFRSHDRDLANSDDADDADDADDDYRWYSGDPAVVVRIGPSCQRLAFGKSIRTTQWP